MKKTHLKALSLCLLLIFCIGAVTATEERTMQVPCLTVRGGTKGNISHQPFTFSIGHSDRPLRILIGDDTPGGSGDEIRNSVWLAATTATLQRKISLQGVKIEVEFSGLVDGPSAGAVFCLAIMSAIDGREFPSDFAMTGTIMPDGTVGAVGGIPAKIRAAAKQGKKRFCIPAVYRFEIFNGEVVDLFRLGKELGVEIFPVDNINEAYCYMHKLPQPVKPNLNARDICRLNDKTEDVIKEQSTELDDLADEYAKKCSGNFKTLLNDQFPSNKYFSLFIQGAFLPLYTHTRGRYITANTIALFESLCKEINKLFPILTKNDLNESDLPKYRDALFALQKELEKLSFEEEEEEEQTSQNTTSISEQLQPVSGLFELLAIKEDMPDWETRKDLDSFSAKELLKIREIQLTNLLVRIFLNFSNNSIVNKSLEKLALTMPQIPENKSAKSVVNLFYQAATSTFNALQDLFDGQEEESQFMEDPKSQAFQLTVKYALIAHNDKDKFSVVDSLLLQLEAFTRGQALLIKYGPDLDTKCNDDGSFSYGNTAFLSYLIRTARENALLRISECKAQGVPCLAAINYFQQAELARDDDGVDKLHDVLENYWRASLLAEALQMCFQK